LHEALLEGDTGYYSENNVQEAAKRGIEVLIPDQQFRKRDEPFEGQKCHKQDEHFTIDDFKYNAESNSYTCPAGKTLTNKPCAKIRGKPDLKWQASVSDCKACPVADKCMKKRGRDASRRGVQRGSKKTILLLDREGKEHLSERMREKIDNPLYRTLYGQRMRIIEPVFAEMTYCKQMNRFTLRGQKKVNAQWLLYCMVHNIAKCAGPLGERYAG
jgi:hypothetical protein